MADAASGSKATLTPPMASFQAVARFGGHVWQGRLGLGGAIDIECRQERAARLQRVGSSASGQIGQRLTGLLHIVLQGLLRRLRLNCYLHAFMFGLVSGSIEGCPPRRAKRPPRHKLPPATGSCAAALGRAAPSGRRRLRTPRAAQAGPSGSRPLSMLRRRQVYVQLMAVLARRQVLRGRWARLAIEHSLDLVALSRQFMLNLG